MKTNCRAAARCLLLCLGLALLLAAADAGVKRVTMREKEYHPDTIRLKVGESVEWHNDDDRDHTVTATDNGFKSGNIGVGNSYRHRFTRAGEYPYQCDYHPRMKGKVLVEE